MAANSILYFGLTDALTEIKTSPKYDFAEKVTITKTYQGLFALCVASALPKGTFGTGDLSGFLCGKSSVQKLGNGFGQLDIVWEAGGEESGQTLPPDEFSVEPFDVNPPLEKHSVFAAVSDAEKTKVNTAREGATIADRNTAIEQINATGTDAATVLLDLKMKGVENYYLAGLRYSWTLHFWNTPDITLGGFIQAPQGPLSGQFPEDMSFLRESDSHVWTGQYHKVTRNWIGGPAGHWDADLYAS